MTPVPAPDSGLIHVSSSYSVAETAKRLEASLLANGMTIFCRVDHSRKAEKAGLPVPRTQLLIFGSPKSGTPLMLASPTMTIDLPLKALIWQDAGGKVWLTYNSPEYLQQRHNVPPEAIKNIAGPTPLLQAAAT
jgi:uncharacterized protein (DUF302 family)